MPSEYSIKDQFNHSVETLERLAFRRQFILGPEEVDGIPKWKRYIVNDTFSLHAHPDLEVFQAKNQDKSIILIGYILDPDDAQAGNSEIVERLIGYFGRIEDVIENTNKLGGRWAIIANVGIESVMFHDAAGLRQVYFSHSAISGETVCASQPGLIAGILDLPADSEAIDFMKTRESADKYDNFKVYWWPGDSSLYQGIKLLLPNNYLDLRTGKTCRYWPKKDLQAVSEKDAVLKISDMLRGFIKSAHFRYDMALSLTAGWDSRVMLGASRDIVHDFYCFTLTYPTLKENINDVIIPSKLMSRLGLKHNIINYPEHIDEEFKNIRRKNSPSVNKAYCADVQAMYDHMPKNLVCITGDIAEAIKCYYRTSGGNRKDVSARDLAMFTKMGTHPFAIRSFGKWLEGINPFNIHILDLFSWEQVGGRWQAHNQADCDIVFESFSPYNCRELLTTVLSIDEKYRKPPVFTFHKKLISKLWKEILSEPINPPEKTTLKTLAIDMLAKLHIYHLVPESAKTLMKRLIN